MIPTDDQNAAIMHGLDEVAPLWRPIDRPAGRFETPDWCGGVHVDWMLGWANGPRLMFKEVAPIVFPDIWKHDQGRWWREGSDGLIEQLWHKGVLSRRADGSYETTQQQGFGGRTWTVKVDSYVSFETVLDEGPFTVHLRGLWFGGTQQGFSELTLVDCHTRDRHLYRDGRPWHKQGGTFGYYIPDELKIRLLSRYCPELPLAYVTQYGRTYVEPYLEEWGCPKNFRKEKGRGE